MVIKFNNMLALLQARTSSTRFPGKVMRPILGLPMFLRQIERLRRSTSIDQLVVVTSVEASDDELAKQCVQHGVACFRGSLNDVLDRFYQATRIWPMQHVVRLTADCPLTDPLLIDRVIDFYLQGDFDYVSNTGELFYPDGLDVEVLRVSCLARAWREAVLPSQREHVTLFLRTQPECFKIGHYKEAGDNLSHLRWTVDAPVDFELVERIYLALYPNKPDFTTQDILHLLERHPELITINSMMVPNEGMLKSLRQDQEFLDAQASLLSIKATS